MKMNYHTEFDVHLELAKGTVVIAGTPHPHILDLILKSGKTSDVHVISEHLMGEADQKTAWNIAAWSPKECYNADPWQVGKYDLLQSVNDPVTYLLLNFGNLLHPVAPVFEWLRAFQNRFQPDAIGFIGQERFIAAALAGRVNLENLDKLRLQTGLMVGQRNQPYLHFCQTQLMIRMKEAS